MKLVTYGPRKGLDLTKENLAFQKNNGNPTNIVNKIQVQQRWSYFLPRVAATTTAWRFFVGTTVWQFQQFRVPQKNRDFGLKRRCQTALFAFDAWFNRGDHCRMPLTRFSHFDGLSFSSRDKKCK